MSRTSDAGAKLIASYRAATSLRPGQRERALRKLHARLSADPTPLFRPDVSVPELPPPLPAAWVQLRARWKRIVTISKVIVGAALLTWLATEPDPQAGVEHDFAARRAAAKLPGSAAASIPGAEPEPRDELATPARSQLATPSAAQDGSRRELAPTEAHVGLASGASSKHMQPPRTAAAPATATSPSAAARSERAPAHAFPDAPETSTTARSERAPAHALSDARETSAAARSGRAPAHALSDAPETSVATRSGPAPAHGLSDAPETSVATRIERAPAHAFPDAPELDAQDGEPAHSVEDARAAHEVRQRSMPRAGGVRVPERGTQLLGAASLEQETALLEQAQAAMKRGDAERALHLLAEHTWLFPAGHLAEARDVARILALCQAGHAEQARARAKTFLAARPHSPFAARVRASCPHVEAIDKPSSAK